MTHRFLNKNTFVLLIAVAAVLVSGCTSRSEDPSIKEISDLHIELIHAAGRCGYGVGYVGALSYSFFDGGGVVPSKGAQNNKWMIRISPDVYIDVEYWKKAPISGGVPCELASGTTVYLMGDNVEELAGIARALSSSSRMAPSP